MIVDRASYVSAILKCNTAYSCISFHRLAGVPSIGKHQCLFALVERGQVLFLFTHSLQHGESKCQHTYHFPLKRFVALYSIWLRLFALILLHRLLHSCYDDASRFVYLLAKPGCNYLEQEDFIPLLQVRTYSTYISASLITKRYKIMIMNKWSLLATSCTFYL